jgi:hypothetical protein
MRHRTRTFSIHSTPTTALYPQSRHEASRCGSDKEKGRALIYPGARLFPGRIVSSSLRWCLEASSLHLQALAVVLEWKCIFGQDRRTAVREHASDAFGQHADPPLLITVVPDRDCWARAQCSRCPCLGCACHRRSDQPVWPRCCSHRVPALAYRSGRPVRDRHHSPRLL